MNAERRSNFAGTYFNKDAVLWISRSARVLAWVVLGVHLVQLFVSLITIVLQIVRGFWVGMGYTDMIQSFVFAFQTPLHGVVYFFALLGVAEILLIFLDIEDNTRRAARDKAV
jgi:hypothetical protein